MLNPSNGNFGTHAVISYDKSTILISGYNNSAWVWKYDNNTDTYVYTHELARPTSGGASGKYGRYCGVSGDGRTVVVSGQDTQTANGVVWVWTYDDSTDTWTPQQHLTRPTTGGKNGTYGEICSISADGKTILVTGGYDSSNNTEGVAWIWKLDNGVWTNTQHLTRPTSSALRYGDVSTLSIDGKVALVTGIFGGAFVWNFNDATGLYEPYDLSKYNYPGQYGESQAISGDGTTAVICLNAANPAGSVFVWKGVTTDIDWSGIVANTESHLLSSPPGFTRAIASDVSSGGTRAVISGYTDSSDGNAYVWNFDGQAWTFVQELTRPTAFVGYYGECTSISGDGNTVVVSGYDTTVGGAVVWTHADNQWSIQQELTRPDTFSGAYGNFCAISDDGFTVVVTAQSANSVVWKYNGTEWVVDQELVKRFCACILWSMLFCIS